MLTVGLTGGIGSGKSTVARLLASYGAVVVDADAIAREVVEPGTPGLQAVVEVFGEEILREDGSLDRDRLAQVVFAEPAALARLEAITHPLVGERSRQLIDAAAPDAVVVHDVPLLVEKGMGGAYDVVVVVDASDEVRIDRLTRSRGLSEADARARMATQASSEERREAADVVIGNDGSVDDLEAQVIELWEELHDRLA